MWNCYISTFDVRNIYFNGNIFQENYLKYLCDIYMHTHKLRQCMIYPFITVVSCFGLLMLLRLTNTHKFMLLLWLKQFVYYMTVTELVYVHI